MVICNFCHHENEPSAQVCDNCGMVLDTLGLTVHTRLVTSGGGGLSERMGDLKHTEHFGKLPDHGVAIYVGGAEHPVILAIRSRLTLGRRREIPDPDLLDLTPYDAYKMGMSRSHAVLFFKDGMLCVQDLGSANGTFVNNTRLQPHDVVALLPGTSITLAQLVIHIYY